LILYTTDLTADLTWRIPINRIIEACVDSLRMKFKNMLFFSIIISLLVYMAYLIAIRIAGADFFVYYCAGKIVLNPDLPDLSIYDVNTLMKCSVPEFLTEEHRRQTVFIYSVPAAYFMSPLALLPYFHSKALLISLNLVSYAFAIIILLKNINPIGKTLSAGYLLLAGLWLPLKNDVLFGQINSILLLLVVLAAIATLRAPYLAGILLGIASLFKLFPILIAFFLGLKNWRILAACFLTIAISVLGTFSLEWLTAIGNINRIGATPVYKLINDFNLFWYVSYVFMIVGISTMIVVIKNLDYYYIVSLSITVLFIIMPIIEYYHLVLLIFSIIYIASNISLRCWMFKLLSCSIVLIFVSQVYELATSQNMIYISCFMLWTLLICYGIKQCSLMLVVQKK
jgi:hypothetical protein